MYRQFTLTIIPEQLLLITQFFSDWQGTCLLYSGGTLDSAQYSYLGLFPFETVTVYDRQLFYRKGNQYQKFNVNNPWQGLQEHFFDGLAQDPHAMAFGWLGYGMGAYADLDQILPYRPSSVPDAYWQRCAIRIILDLSTHQASIQVDLSAAEFVAKEMNDWLKNLSTLQGWHDFIQALPQFSMIYESCFDYNFFDCSQRKDLYTQKIKQVQELIRAGEVYQVNLSQEFTFQSERHPFSLFRQICDLNPAPFSVYFHHEQCTIISTSPERFLCKRGQWIETRPIKGTVQRGKTAEEDQLLKEQLLFSIKERAELLMITDLMRNDLGKISRVGSVQTVDIWRCEAYTNVFHLLSIIRSQAKPELTPLEIVRSCFPGGSITGCPKLRAMEVIDALEKRSRGIYTGAMGYFTGQGDFDLNIAIRTLVAENHNFSLQLGGGIVIDSNSDHEYNETLFKGTSIFHILQTKEILCD